MNGDYHDPRNWPSELYFHGSSEAVLLQLAAWLGKIGLDTLEVGLEYDETRGEAADPEPGELATYYAEATLAGHRAVAKITTTDHDGGPILATIALIRDLGATVDVQDNRPPGQRGAGS